MLKLILDRIYPCTLTSFQCEIVIINPAQIAITVDTTKRFIYKFALTRKNHNIVIKTKNRRTFKFIYRLYFLKINWNSLYNGSS